MTAEEIAALLKQEEEASAAVPLETPELSAAREERDRDVALATIAQGLTTIGSGIAGQRPDSRVFDSARASAERKAVEATSDAQGRRKMVLDAIKSKQADAKQAAKDELDQTRLNQNDRRLDLMEKALTQKGDAMAQKGTPGQQAIDREFGKQYAQRVGEGGYSDPEKQLSALDDAVDRLGKTSTATGPLVSLVPDVIRQRMFPEGQSIRDTVEDVVQRNLRKVLGAQFTEKEGERLIARAYNPALSEGENIKRLKRLKNQMLQALKTQQTADQYFEQHGTMQGYSGRQYKSADDFNLEADQETPAAAPAAGGGGGKRKPAPGAVVTVKGKRYRVGSDGDSLEPLQ